MVTLLRRAFRELGKKDPLRLAGATAFFATFALPAILFLFLQLFRLLLTPQQGSDRIYDRLDNYVGPDAATHVINVLKGFEKIAESPLAVTTGVAFLIFVGTTLFKVIKNSINDIWNVRIVQKLTPAVIAKNRLRELTIILSACLLLLFTVSIDGIQSLAHQEFVTSSTLSRVLFSQWTSLGISILVSTLWFGIIFCFLPDGRLPNKICFTGAFLTSVLFTAGKMVIKWALLYSNLNVLFGKSSAVVLLLLFVFYSSLMFYYGATFTRVLAEKRNIPVRPLKHAEAY
jgi:membrane protein